MEGAIVETVYQEAVYAVEVEVVGWESAEDHAGSHVRYTRHGRAASEDSERSSRRALWTAIFDGSLLSESDLCLAVWKFSRHVQVAQRALSGDGEVIRHTDITV